MSLRHERRRRPVADDTLSSSSADESDAPLRLAGDLTDQLDAPSSAYAAVVRFDCQRRVLDLLPRRPLAIAWFLFAALLLIGLVELLHVGSQSMAVVLDSEDVRALNLDRPHNVSHWLSSMLLGVGSLMAVLIYSLRRHRVDDYHGRYRVWLWTALGCMLVSLAEASDLVRLVHAACRHLAEMCSVADSVIWPASVGTLLTAAAIRLFVEVRRCRLAASTLVASAGCFLIAAAVEHDLFVEFTLSNKPLVERGSWLVGYVLVLATFLWYARHVLLEIEGVVALAPAKRRRPKARASSSSRPEKSSTESAPKPSLHLRSDLDPVEKPSVGSGVSSVRMGVHQGTSAHSSVSVNEANGRGLSRAERRRMRRDARMAG